MQRPPKRCHACHQPMELIIDNWWDAAKVYFWCGACARSRPIKKSLANSMELIWRDGPAADHVYRVNQGF